MPYIALDYWMICDRCGSEYRRSEMREEWTGLWVCTRNCWEIRHPQDFVKGVKDDPTVDVARPDIPQTMGETTLSRAHLKNEVDIFVASTAGISEDDPIGIVLDNGVVHWSFVDELSEGEVMFGGDTDVRFGGDPDVRFGDVGGYITLGSHLPYTAASGNVVYLPGINNESWV